jgi:type I restriction enzyme, S subunit
MRDNWNYVNLGAYVKLQGGFAFSSNSFLESGIPLVRISNVTNSGIAKDFVYLPTEFLIKHNDFALNKGDIIIAMSGATTGKNCQVSQDNIPALLNQRTGRFKVIDSNSLDNQFLSHLVKFPEFQNILLIDAVGGAQPNISSGQIESLKVWLPPLPQQRKIANILSTCDQVIEKTEAAIAKYQALKQGMMHDLFTRGIDVKTGKLRPSYQDAPELYKESELGMIPKEWEEGQFIDFADERISHSFTGGPFGSDLQTRDYTKEGVRIIQLQNIGDGKFNNGYKIYTSEEKANYLRACNIYPGEIILSKMAEPIARACIIPISNDRYLMASDGIRLSIDKKRFNLRFVLETINQKRFRNIAEIRSTGTTRSRIGLTELKGIPVCYPQKNEQDIIGIKLDNLEESIEIEQSALSKYQQLKAGLMQDLLTGKVEVSVAEEVLKN